MKKSFIIFSLTLLTFFSCNAPRDNPLDPYSTKAGELMIEGKVENFTPPFSGISNVSVLWAPANRLAKTDNQGNFKIVNIKPENGLLIFSKEGYLSDSILINWDDTKKITRNVNLNKIPVLDSVSFYSITMLGSDSSQTSYLNADAKIIDPDNDIDSVVVKNSQLKFIKKLDFNADDKHYRVKITPEDLHVPDLEKVVGLDFKILVYDVFNRKFDVGSVKIIRIINSNAEIISPVNGDTVNNTPRLTWKRFGAQYNFTYTVEIFNDNTLLRSVSDVVFSEENISSDKTFLDVKNPLQPDRYYWVIWVVDQFNNRSRSFNGSFVVN